MVQSRYIQKLKENLTGLQISSQTYDQGLDGEAIRLATSLRVLFHSNPSNGNISLIQHLKMDQWNMLSSSTKIGDPTGFVSVVINLASPTPLKAIPKLGNQFNPILISDWWTTEAVVRSANKDYFRSSLIKAAANRDGGCHVDSKLDQFYKDLEEGGSLPLVLNGQNCVYPNNKAPYDQSKSQHCRNVHLAMLRQFSHEVLYTATHYQWLETLAKQP